MATEPVLRKFDAPVDYLNEMDSIADSLTEALKGCTANESLYKAVTTSVARLQRMADHYEVHAGV